MGWIDSFLGVTNKWGGVVGLLSLIPIIWTLIEVRLGKKRRHKMWVKEAREATSERAAILLCDFKDGNMVQQFRASQKTDPRLKSVPDDRIVELKFNKSHITQDDLPEIARRIKEKRHELGKIGADIVYLAYGGPCVIATMVGAELSNGFMVNLLHYEGSHYTIWGPMEHRCDV